MANYNPPNNIEGKKSPGRPKGSPNVATAEIREYLKMLVADQLPHLEEALDRVREKDPGKYVSLLTRLNELVLPKLQNIEISNTPTIDLEATIKNIQETINK